MKLPEITISSRSKVGVSVMLGAETTSWSSTIASCWDGHTGSAEKHLVVMALNWSMPGVPLLNSGVTTHEVPVCGSSTASAPLMALPVRAVGPRRNRRMMVPVLVPLGQDHGPADLVERARGDPLVVEPLRDLRLGLERRLRADGLGVRVTCR